MFVKTRNVPFELRSLFGGIALFLSPFSAFAEETQEIKGGLPIGESAPTFALKTMNPDLSKQKLFALKNLVGAETSTPKKAVLLTFAASYCQPCKHELAQLKTLSGRIDKAGVQLAAVVIDREDQGIEEMRKLAVDELALNFPVLLDRYGILARRYKADNLPYLVVIDAKGIVQSVHVGYQPGQLEKVLLGLGVPSS